MNYADAIKYLLPDAEFVLRRTDDYASLEWIGPGAAPTLPEVEAALAEVQRREAVARHNAPILAELAEADQAIVRAIAEGDAERVAAHIAAQAERRARLLR